jgi:UDP-N-acetylglucosamine 4-epimerase
MDHLDAILHHPNFKLIGGDIRNMSDCTKACKGVDAIVHQAALGSVPRSFKDPVAANDVNISGFVNILEAARNYNINRVVYAASSSTYGDSKDSVHTENTIGKPLSPYAITKYVNELYADLYQQTYGINTIGLRYFNVFGKHQDPNGSYAAVIPKFIRQFMEYQSPTIYGDGSHSRDFTHVSNVVAANILALSTNNTEAFNQVYNIAYGERTTLNSLVAKLQRRLVNFDENIANVAVSYGETRVGDMPHMVANINKAKELLDYEPSVSFEAGLDEAIAWYWESFSTEKQLAQ